MGFRYRKRVRKPPSFMRGMNGRSVFGVWEAGKAVDKNTCL